MQVGTTLGRRFTLVRRDEPAPTGTERWIADDTRLAHRVTVDIVRGDLASPVRRRAAGAARVRDARFARIISTGRHTEGDDAVAYVVSERPRGKRGDILLKAASHHPDAAATLVGDAARALHAVRALDVSHGALTASSLVVSPAGRVIVTGLGVDAGLASARGGDAVPSERADAAALARIYVEAVTGLGIENLTAADIPATLGTGQTALAHAVVAGDPPSTLRELITMLGPAQASALRTLRTVASSASSSETPVSPATPASAPSAASVAHATEASQVPAVAGLPPVDGAEVVPPVAPPTDPAAGTDSAAPTPDLDDLPPAAAEPLSPRDIAISPVTLVAAATAADTSIAKARMVHSDEPLTLVVDDSQRPPDPKLEPMRAWDSIVDAQNAEPAPSFVEWVIGGLRKLAPRSEVLESAHVKAHARAHRTAPLRVGPLLVALTVLAVMLVVVISWEEIAEPLQADFDLNNNPPNSYPTYTYSPEPYPTASPSPSE